MAVNSVTERAVTLRERIHDRRIREAFADAAAESRPGTDADLASTTLIPGWFLTACVRQQADRQDTVYVVIDRDVLDRKLASAGMPVLERCHVAEQLATVTTPELESAPAEVGAENHWASVIAEICDARHWNQSRLAAELGISQTMISMWKLGKQRPGEVNAAKLRQCLEEMS